MHIHYRVYTKFTRRRADTGFCAPFRRRKNPVHGSGTGRDRTYAPGIDATARYAAESVSARFSLRKETRRLTGGKFRMTRIKDAPPRTVDGAGGVALRSSIGPDYNRSVYQGSETAWPGCFALVRCLAILDSCGLDAYGPGIAVHDPTVAPQHGGAGMDCLAYSYSLPTICCTSVAR